MTNFFERKDPWGHGWAMYVIAAVIFIVPPCWLSLRQIDLENDVQSWLPEDDEQAITLKWYLSHFPNEETVFLTWEGSAIDDPRIALLKRQLEGKPDAQGIPRGGSEYVTEVKTPREGLQKMLDRKIEQPEAVRRLTGLLIGRGPLKIKLTETGALQKKQFIAQLQQEARQRLELDLKILDAFTPPEPGLTDVQVELLTKIEEEEASAAEEEDEVSTENIVLEIPAHDLQVTFRGIDYSPEKVSELQKLIEGLRSPASKNLPEGEPLVESTFFAAGSPVAVVVRLNESGIADKEHAIDTIRDAALSLGIPKEELHLGGRTVASAALNREVVKAGYNRDYPWSKIQKRSPILLSCIVGVLLCFFMLRSARLAMLVIFSGMLTVYVTLTLVPLTHGSMNMVLIVMPTLLWVLTLSGAIHVANYWKHAAKKTPDKAVPNAYRLAWKPCFLASATTAIGLTSLVTSPLVPVKDFGLYSAIGCMISFLVILYVLPSLLQFWPGSSGSVHQVNSRPWEKLGRWLARHNRSVAAACMLMLIGCSIGLMYFHTETKVIRYFPEDSQVVHDYRYLEENLVHIVPVDTIVEFHTTAQSNLTFLERMEIVRRVEERIRKHPEISGTLSLADFFPEETEIPAADSGFRTRGLFIRKSNRIEEKVHENKTATASFLSLPVPEGETAPAEDTDHRYAKSEPEDELWRITAQVAIMSDLDYGTLTEEINELAKEELRMYDAEHVVTGMVPIFLRTQQAVLESLIRSFGYAFAVIAVVMVIVLKDVPSGLVTMLPNLWPVGVVFGLISWCRLDVDIGTMITASVALGIAVDGTLHLLTWYREGIAEGKSREDAIALAMGHCAPAMWQTSASVGAGLLMLSFADLLLVSRFGWLMAALIGAALWGDLVMLPALLAGSLGNWIARKVRAEDQQASMNLDEEAAISGEAATPEDSELSESVGTAPEPHLHATTRSDGKILRNDPGSKSK